MKPQLTVLAEALGECGEKVSPQRLQIYAGDLADLDQRQLEIAFRRAQGVEILPENF